MTQTAASPKPTPARVTAHKAGPWSTPSTACRPRGRWESLLSQAGQQVFASSKQQVWLLGLLCGPAQFSQGGLWVFKSLLLEGGA